MRDMAAAAAEEHEVVIVGGGIAGLATAIALQRVGIESIVLERSHELRATGASIGLFPNAWRALEALGVSHKLDALYKPITTGRITNLETGASQTTSLTPPSARNPIGPRVVHRKVLLEALAGELPAGTIRFSSKLSSIKTETQKDSSTTTTVLLHLEDGATMKTKMLIGCDGVHSVVAQWLGLSQPIHSGRSGVRGLSVYPEGHGIKDTEQLVGPNIRAGIAPINDKDLYWFITHPSLPKEEEVPRDPEIVQKEVMKKLAGDLPAHFKTVIQHTDPTTLSWAPLMFRVPWDVIMGPTYKGCVTVAGDAFHPMTPDMAQGGATALEDAVVLGRCLAQARNATDGYEKAAETYVKERRWRTAGLIVGAYLSGWIQQGQSGWAWWPVRKFRDLLFYAFVLPRLSGVVFYDCGDLPTKG